MNAINNLADHARAIETGDIIQHQKDRLAFYERLYSEATKAGNYEATQYAAKMCNRYRTALVLHGAMDSVWDVDREARAEEDARERPHKEARWS